MVVATAITPITATAAATTVAAVVVRSFGSVSLIVTRLRVRVTGGRASRPKRRHRGMFAVQLTAAGVGGRGGKRGTQGRPARRMVTAQDLLRTPLVPGPGMVAAHLISLSAAAARCVTPVHPALLTDPAARLPIESSAGFHVETGVSGAKRRARAQTLPCRRCIPRRT